MSKTPNYDAKIKAILDATKPGERVCELTGEKWEMTEEEIGWYRKFQVPPSSISPITCLRILTGFYTGYQWWWQKHPETNKPFLTLIHPATGIQALPDKEWFDRDFSCFSYLPNFNQSFFEQFRKLQIQIPLPAFRNSTEPDNSIAICSWGVKDSYFVNGCEGKSIFYSVFATNSENLSEANTCQSVSESYQINDCQRIYRCQFLRECFDCMNSTFLFDCRNCEYCFGATNKRNRKYLWFNEQLNKEEWEKRRVEVDLSCRSIQQNYWKQFQKLIQEQAIWPENFNEKSESCIGDYLTKCTNCRYCFACAGGPYDNYWCIHLVGDSAENAFSAANLTSNRCYYSNNSFNASDSKFCFGAIRSYRLEYCMYCYDCEDCFGCVGLRHKKFHIFNKTYSQEDYWNTLDQLKCHMLETKEYGDYFPLSFSLSYFPESGAIIYTNAKPESGKQLGAFSFDPEAEGAIGIELSQATNLESSLNIPNCAKEINIEDWKGKVFWDEGYKRRFAYLAPELSYYQRFGIAPPTSHFIKRVIDLVLESNSMDFQTSVCDACKKQIIVGENPTYKNRQIYCESCYLAYLEKNG